MRILTVSAVMTLSGLSMIYNFLTVGIITEAVTFYNFLVTFGYVGLWALSGYLAEKRESRVFKIFYRTWFLVGAASSVCVACAAFIGVSPTEGVVVTLDVAFLLSVAPYYGFNLAMLKTAYFAAISAAISVGMIFLPRLWRFLIARASERKRVLGAPSRRRGGKNTVAERRTGAETGKKPKKRTLKLRGRKKNGDEDYRPSWEEMK